MMHDHFRLEIRTRTIFFILAVIAYLSIVLGARVLFSATAGSDTNTVADLADSGRYGLGTSYAATALVYAYTPAVIRDPLVFATGIGFLWFCIANVKTTKEAAIISFLCLAPCMMAIGTFQKDMLLAWFILPVAAIALKARSDRVVFLSFVLIYLGYALMFRQYFLVIIAVGITAFAFVRSGPIMRMIILASILCILLLVPVDVLEMLQAQRERANFDRIYTFGRSGARTAFLNPLDVTGLWSFTINYLYSFWAMDLSFFSFFGIKELYLTANIFFYYAIMIIAFRKGKRRDHLLASIIFAHIATLHLFEPDSGSYLRHLSSTLPYLTVLLARKHFIEAPSGESLSGLQGNPNVSAA